MIGKTIISLAVAAGFVVGMFVVPASTQTAPTKVRFALQWSDLAYFTPLFVAQEKGFFKQANLDVSLVYGNGAPQALAQTGAGLFDLTWTDAIVGLKAIGTGVPLTMVGTYGPNSVIAYIGLDGHGISQPKDLEGKTLGGPPGDTGIVLLPAFAKFAGFDAAKVKVLNMDAGSRVPALFQHRIDFLVSYDGGSLQVLDLEAKKQGRKAVILLWRDYGFNAMGLVFWSNNDFAKKNPDVVRRFLRAAYQGVQFAMQEPDQAADIYTAVAPALNKEATRAAVKSLMKTFNHPGQIKNGLGYIDPKDLEVTYDIAQKFADMTPLRDLKSAYTNEFVTASPVFPPK
jgi:NitT/TauT family transport system substrate-binding protein